MDILNIVERSDVYKDWITQYPHAQLAHIFVMQEKKQFKDWHVGYVIDDKITSFAVDDQHNVVQHPMQETFKEPGSSILGLERKKLLIDAQKAIDLALAHQEQKFPADVPTKIICLAQHVAVGNIWNITVLSLALRILNIKIRTDTGEVIHAEPTSFFEMRKGSL